jgi:Holliday junction resolvasome RuvABC endonuclease subunit
VNQLNMLAIDPGTSCGFALGNNQGVITSGVWRLAPARGESPGVRYLRLRGYLEDVRKAFPDLNVVAYEQAHHRGGAATEYATGIVTHIQSWCAEHNLEHLSIHSATVKRYATGRGNADKAAMVAAGRKCFKPTTVLDDEIDALWLLACGTSFLGQR